MDRFISLFTIGIAQGAIISIVALGFLLIYKATGVVNFAQGDLVTLGAYVAVWLATDHHWPLLGAYAVAIVLLFGATRRDPVLLAALAVAFVAFGGAALILARPRR